MRFRLTLEVTRRRPRAPERPAAPQVQQHEHRDGFSQVETAWQPHVGFEIPGSE